MPCLPLSKKMYAEKAFHRASFSGEGAICSLWKTVTQNKPIFARRKTDLKRGFTPKKAYAYKAPFWLVLQTARVGSRRSFFPRGNFGAYNSVAQSRYAPFLPQGEYAILKSLHGKRVQALSRLYSCIITYLSPQVNRNTKHMFVIFLYVRGRTLRYGPSV